MRTETEMMGARGESSGTLNGGNFDARPEPPSPEELRRVEPELLDPDAPQAKDALIAYLGKGASEHPTKVVQANLPNGAPFYFRVRGLDEEEEGELIKKHTRRRKDPRLAGAPVTETLERVPYRADRIIKATVAFCVPIGVDEDGNVNVFRDVAPLWESNELREALRDRSGNPVLENTKVVDVLLGSNGIEAVHAIIDSLAGASVSEVAGNS